MTTTYTATVRHSSDHFEPEPGLEPQEQRRLRGYLEQIDYAAFAANRQVVSKTLGRVDPSKFEHMALTTATARARWVATALAFSEVGAALNPDQVEELATARRAYEELAEAYEAMRRLVERGYLGYTTATR